MKLDYKKIFGTIALLEAILLLVLFYSMGIKIDEQKNKLQQQNQELIRLKLVEEDYNADKEYIYECFKQIEQRAERSGK